MKKEQLRFTGSGGQGVIMATIIMAEAAFLDGKQVVRVRAVGRESAFEFDDGQVGILLRGRQRKNDQQQGRQERNDFR